MNHANVNYKVCKIAPNLMLVRCLVPAVVVIIAAKSLFLEGGGCYQNKHMRKAQSCEHSGKTMSLF